jgi:hypothetical protein
MIYVNIILALFSWFKVKRNNIIESYGILLSVTLCNLVGGRHVSDVPTPSIWSKVLLVHTMKACGGEEVYLHSFLSPELAGVSGQPQAPGHFTTVERAHSTHWIGSFVGPRPILDALEKRKISFACHVEPRFLGCPACSLITILTTLSWLPLPPSSGQKSLLPDYMVL